LAAISDSQFGTPGVAGAHRHHDAQRRRRLRHGRHVLLEAIVDQHGDRAAGRTQIRDLRRRQAEVHRHPHGTESERDPAALEHRQRVARLHEQPVALPDAQLAQRGDQGIDAIVDLAPRPLPVALDHAGAVRMESGGLAQQLRQVADLGGVHRKASMLRAPARAPVGGRAALTPPPARSGSWPPPRRPC
jgi:hypothetical protein